MKKLIALLLAMLMVIGLFAGCNTTPDETDPPKDTQGDTTPVDDTTDTTEDTTPEEITLDMWIYDDETYRPIYEAFETNLEATYPWIDLQYTWLPYDAGPEKVTVAFATKNTPDILSDAYMRIGAGVDAGLTISLEPAIAQIEGLSALPITGVINGEHHYIWMGGENAYGIGVNMDIAAELGIEEYLPEDGLTWSWDDFLTCCRAAKDAGYVGIPLWAGSRSSDMWYYTWYLGAGVELTDAVANGGTVTKATFNDDQYKEASLKVLNLFKTIVDEGLCQPGPAIMIDQDTETLWFSGNALFRHCGFNNSSYFENNFANGTSLVENFEIFAVPTPDGTVPSPTGSGGHSGIVAFDTADGAKLDAIYTTVAFLFNKESGFLQQVQDAIPATNPVADWIEIDLENLSENAIRININRGNGYALEYARSDWGPLNGWYSDFREQYWPLLQEFYIGELTAEELLAKWETNVNEVIANHQVVE